MRRMFFNLAVLALMCTSVPGFSFETEAPAKLQAALIMKLLTYYNNLGTKDYTIYVVGAEDVANELKGAIGKKTGKATLAAVTSGATAPSGGADIVYVGADVQGSISYTQRTSTLSITGNPDFLNQGVTLGIGLAAGKPKIFLNLTASKAENADWNPAILKVAKTL